MGDVKKNIQLLFDRPREPLFMPKGGNDTVFEITPEYLTDKYANMGIELSNRFGNDASEKIPLNSINGPDLSSVDKNVLPESTNFSTFIPLHRTVAALLIDMLMAIPEGELQELLALAAFCRDRVNSQLFNYCLSVALLHRNDTRDVPIPNFAEKFPSKFLDPKTLQSGREIAEYIPNQMRAAFPIELPMEYTASDLEVEHRVAYFREDIGINLHHWHWHLIYPFQSNTPNVVNKDRRGELFYYMHAQIMARYDVERLCNDMGRVRKFNNFREPITEGYFPKLDSLTAGRAWPPRQSGMVWQDVNRPVDQFFITVDQVELWRNRIEEAISSGYVNTADGGQRPLDIDTLGNMLEASTLSPNQDYYGDLHNFGHLLTALIHDPEHKYLESVGVMGSTETAMRDPFFYRWHAQIDRLFQKFKASSLSPPYRRSQLINPDISMTSFSIDSQGSTNEISTFWMKSDLNISRGLDFAKEGAVYVRFTHLNHAPFYYNIEVNNAGEAKFGTVRIFLAPKLDERGLPWQLDQQRTLFIELDKFRTMLQPGDNTIRRTSEQSSVTIPFDRTFRELTLDDANRNNYCGCGWPQHMLIPKGKPEGMPFQCFVMISNYDHDRVEQEDGIECDGGESFCGLSNRLYPDRRAMGYPFDRPADPQFGTIEDLIQPNMMLADVTIRFDSQVRENPKNLSNKM